MHSAHREIIVAAPSRVGRMRRDLVAVVEVARDRRVDPDRTCCRVDDAAVHDKLVGFVHAAWSCPVGCDVECPLALKGVWGHGPHFT